MPSDNTNAPVVVKADATVKKLYLAAMVALTAAKTADAKAFHRRYEITSQIIEHAPPLYLAGSYATEKEFFQAELQESPQSVYRNLRVARLATPEEVAIYSPTRLNLGIVYYEAKTKTTIDKRGDVDFNKLRIDIERDEKPVVAPLKKVTYAELIGAIARLSDPAKKTPKSELTRLAESAIKRTGVKEVKVTFSKTSFSVRGPLSGINAVWRAIAEVA